MYEDVYDEIRDLEARLEDPGTSSHERSRLQGRLTRLRRALDEKAQYSDDPLVDKWERELAEGLVPDLDENL